MAILDLIWDNVMSVQSWRLVLATVVSVVLVIIGRRLCSPVSRIPGPFLSQFTWLPVIYQDSKRNKTLWTLSLHKTYGPLVRLSPNEISVSSAGSMHAVYFGSSKTPAFPKGPLYDHLMHFDARNTSSSISPESHQWHRRIVGPCYTQSIIAAKEAVNGRLWKKVGDWLQYLESESVPSSVGGQDSKAVDVYRVNAFYAVDTATSHFFLHGSSALAGDENARRWIRGASETSAEVVTYFKMEFDMILHSVKIFMRYWRHFVRLFDAGSTIRSQDPADEHNAQHDAPVWAAEVKDWAWDSYRSTRQALESLTLPPGEEPVAARLAANVIEGENADGMEEPVGEDKGLRIRRRIDKSGRVGAETGRWIRDESAVSELMVTVPQPLSLLHGTDWC